MISDYTKKLRSENSDAVTMLKKLLSNKGADFKKKVEELKKKMTETKKTESEVQVQLKRVKSLEQKVNLEDVGSLPKGESKVTESAKKTVVHTAISSDQIKSG